MPPVKEIHYFDISDPRPLIVTACTTTSGYSGRRAREKLRVWLRQLVTPGREAHLGWHLRYFLRRRDDAWYASLFTPGPGQITGDVTPAYARLDAPEVARIGALMPHAKVIYLLRNPIQRMWSQAAMHFTKFGFHGLDTVRDEEIERWFEKKAHDRNSEYSQNLDIWRRFFPGEQIFIGFFDQLREEPGVLLRDIYDFLGVDSSPGVIPATAGIKVNARRYPPMPDDVARALTRRYYAEIEQLHQHFANRYTAAWLEFANRYRQPE